MQPIPILMYHSIAAEVDPRYRRWSVSPERFSAHMDALACAGYTVLSLSALADRLTAGAPLPKRPIALTFDDGLRDFQTGAIPILDRYGFTATLYVVAGAVAGTSRWLAPLGEGERPMLRADELEALHSKGIEIGGHSLTHPELDLLDPVSSAQEIRHSRRLLEDMIGARVTSFAYPHGYATRVTRQQVAEAGYRAAVRVRHALSERSEDRYGLSRLIITEDYDGDGLLALVKGKGVPIAPPQDRLAGTCWRLARRLRRTLTVPRMPAPAPVAPGRLS